MQNLFSGIKAGSVGTVRFAALIGVGVGIATVAKPVKETVVAVAGKCYDTVFKKLLSADNKGKLDHYRDDALAFVSKLRPSNHVGDDSPWKKRGVMALEGAALLGASVAIFLLSKEGFQAQISITEPSNS